MKTLKWAVVVSLGLGMTACAGQTPRPAPFYDYNQTVLNADRAHTFNRSQDFDPFGVEKASWASEKKADKPAAARKAFSPPPLVEWRPETAKNTEQPPSDPTPFLVESTPDVPVPPTKAVPLPGGPSARDMLGTKANDVLGPEAQAKTAPPKQPWKPKEETPKAKAEAPKAPVAPPADKKAPKAPPVSEKIIGVVHAASFIQAIYKINGVDVTVGQGGQAIAELHASFKRKGRIYHATRPAVGDVVFFHNTFDRNQDGRNNDWYTHVGLVEGVDEDGTVHVLSYFDGRVDSIVINLEHPRDAKNKGKTWNARLRTPAEGDAAFTRYLGGELFASFGSLLGDRTELMVVDNWSPGMDIEGL